MWKRRKDALLVVQEMGVDLRSLIRMQMYIWQKGTLTLERCYKSGVCVFVCVCICAVTVILFNFYSVVLVIFYIGMLASTYYLVRVYNITFR